MRGFQLVARINDEQLFRKAIHELGTLLYKVDSENHVDEVAYFSGSRVIHFVGKLSEEMAKIVRAEGFQVDELELDEFAGCLKIVQKGKEVSEPAF